MSGLVSNGGEEAVERLKAELSGESISNTFDPLMSMNNFFWSEALRNGGLYIMGQNETGENDGHYCPICEFEKHAKGFVAKEAIGDVADQMATWCRSQGLIPDLQ